MAFPADIQLNEQLSTPMNKRVDEKRAIPTIRWKRKDEKKVRRRNVARVDWYTTRDLCKRISAHIILPCPILDEYTMRNIRKIR